MISTVDLLQLGLLSTEELWGFSWCGSVIRPPSCPGHCVEVICVYISMSLASTPKVTHWSQDGTCWSPAVPVSCVIHTLCFCQQGWGTCILHTLSAFAGNTRHFILAILVGVRWQLKQFPFLFLYWLATKLTLFSCACFPTVYPFGEVSLWLLPVFWLVSWVFLCALCTTPHGLCEFSHSSPYADGLSVSPAGLLWHSIGFAPIWEGLFLVSLVSPRSRFLSLCTQPSVLVTGCWLLVTSSGMIPPTSFPKAL